MSQPDPNHWIILRQLKATPGGFVSGSVLADRLKLSRTAIWKHIQTLRTLGYEISSHPKKGYRLEALPDLLIPQEVLPHLTTAWMGHTYHYFQTLGSTNDHALGLASRGAPSGTLVVAETQTAGKGRLHRPWESPSRHGVYMSIVLRAALPPREAPQCNLVAGLALARYLSRAYGVPTTIKWPNDVLLNGKKVAGILTEMQSDQDRTRFLVVGVGINVNQSREDFSGSFRYPPTSLALEVEHPVMRQSLLVGFLSSFEDLFETFQAEGFKGFREEMESFSEILNRTVRVHVAEDSLVGKVTGFTPEGALRLTSLDGQEHVVWAGDVARVDRDLE